MLGPSAKANQCLFNLFRLSRPAESQKSLDFLLPAF